MGRVNEKESRPRERRTWIELTRSSLARRRTRAACVFGDILITFSEKDRGGERVREKERGGAKLLAHDELPLKVLPLTSASWLFPARLSARQFNEMLERHGEQQSRRFPFVLASSRIIIRTAVEIEETEKWRTRAVPVVKTRRTRGETEQHGCRSDRACLISPWDCPNRGDLYSRRCGVYLGKKTSELDTADYLATVRESYPAWRRGARTPAHGPRARKIPDRRPSGI